jgi:phytoene dehydrogenase-like protein
MIPHMIPEFNLPDDYVWGIKNLKHSGFMALNQHIALKEEPVWKNGYDNHWVEYSHSDTYEFKKAFQDLELGIPRNDLINAFIATKLDPTRAPEGKHTMYLYSFEPYNLRDGGPEKWDEIKKDVADEILGRMQDLATNLGSDNILGRSIFSPVDYERHNLSMIKGDINHFGCHSVQMQGLRPLSGWHRYRTPVKNLYIAGASTHPGPGVNGGGRAGVQVVMEDLGIDFEKVIS